REKGAFAVNSSSMHFSIHLLLRVFFLCALCCPFPGALRAASTRERSALPPDLRKDWQMARIVNALPSDVRQQAVAAWERTRNSQNHRLWLVEALQNWDTDRLTIWVPLYVIGFLLVLFTAGFWLLAPWESGLKLALAELPKAVRAA